MNEPWLSHVTYEKDIWVCPFVRVTWLIRTGGTSHSWVRYDSFVWVTRWMNHVKHEIESWHSDTNASCHKDTSRIRVTSHIWISHGTNMTESRHKIWLSCVTQYERVASESTNKSCQKIRMSCVRKNEWVVVTKYEWVVSPNTKESCHGIRKSRVRKYERVVSENMNELCHEHEGVEKLHVGRRTQSCLRCIWCHDNHICVHTCIYINMFVYMYIYIYIHTNTYIYVFIYILCICIYICMYIYILICICIHIYVFVYIYLCMYIYIYVHIYIHICINVYVYLCMYIYILMYMYTYMYI